MIGDSIAEEIKEGNLRTWISLPPVFQQQRTRQPKDAGYSLTDIILSEGDW